MRHITLMVAQPFEGVADEFIVRAEILGELRWSKKRHLRPGTPPNISDLGIVSGQYHSRDGARLARVLDRVHDQRLAADLTEILTRHALGAAAGRHQGKNFAFDLSWIFRHRGFSIKPASSQGCARPLRAQRHALLWSTKLSMLST